MSSPENNLTGSDRAATQLSLEARNEEQSGSTSERLLRETDTGMSDLIAKQKTQLEYLKSGGRSDISNKFGLPVICDLHEKPIEYQLLPQPTADDIRSAQGKLDQKIEANEAHLSPQEQETRRKLEHAILDGDQKQIEAVLQSYKDDPRALNKIMTEISKDLQGTGIHISWEYADTKLPWEDVMHSVGTLKISEGRGSREVVFSTDAQLPTYLVEPTNPDGSPRYFLHETDPAKVLKSIGETGINVLNGKRTPPEELPWSLEPERPFRPWPSEPADEPWMRPEEPWKPLEPLKPGDFEIPPEDMPSPPVNKEEVAQAEKEIDKKIEANEESLSAQEQQTRKKLDHAILEGNAREVVAIIQSYKDNPEALRSIVAAVAGDLSAAGVTVGLQVGNMMIGSDTAEHPVAILNVGRTGASKALYLYSDKRLGIEIGGRGVALDGDPDEVMQDIGNNAVKHNTADARQKSR